MYSHRHSLVVGLVLAFALLSAHGAHGQWAVEWYHPNGELHTLGQVDADGQRDGSWKEYAENGILILDAQYENGRRLDEKIHDSDGRLTLEVSQDVNGRDIYRSYFANGRLATHSDIDPRLLDDSTFVADRPYTINRFAVEGHLSEQAIVHPFGSGNALPLHHFHGRSRPALIRAAHNRLEWHRYAGIARAVGVFSPTEGPYDLMWPERGVADEAARAFVREGKARNKLTNYFIDRLPYGTWVNYYENGDIWYEIHFEDGLPDGLLQSFYADGQTALKCTYVKGLLDGECAEYWPSGALRSKSIYRSGVPTGEWTEWDTHGTIIAQRVYEDNGRSTRSWSDEKGTHRTVTEDNADGRTVLSDETTDLDGRLHLSDQGGTVRTGTDGRVLYSETPYGVRLEYLTDGTYDVGVMRDGHAIGWSIVIGENGRAVEARYHWTPSEFMTARYAVDGTYEVTDTAGEKDDKKTITTLFKKLVKSDPPGLPSRRLNDREGNWTMSYPNGKKWLTIGYAEGRLNGNHSVWNIDGSPLIIARFNDGLPHGDHVVSDIVGRTLETRSYRNGVLDGDYDVYSAESGLLIRTEQFSDGSLDGSSTRYADGEVIERTTYMDGLKEGRWTSGNDGEFTSYKAGILHGPARETDRIGRLWEGEYRAGYRTGQWTLSAGGKKREVDMVLGREQVNVDSESCRFPVLGPTMNSIASMRPFTDRMSLEMLSSWTDGDLNLMGADYALIQEITPFPSGDSAQIVILDRSQLEFSGFPGFAFDLAPDLPLGQYAPLGISWMKKNYALRDIPRFDSQEFEGSAMDYLYIGMDHYGMDMASMKQMGRDLLTQRYDISSDSAMAIVSRATEGIADVDQQITAFFRATVDGNEAANSPDALSSIDALFEPIAGQDMRQQMDRIIGQYTVDLRTGRVGLEMPAFQLSAAKGGGDEGARLMFSPDLLQYNTETGLSVINDRDHCMAEGHIGGSAFTLDFDQAQIILKPRNMRELTTNGQDYYFFAENLGADFTGVFVPEAWGQFATDNGGRVFLEYSNIGITDKYLAGRLKIQLPEEHSHEVFKEMEKAFTYHEIISEWDGLEIYFMRLRPKAP